MLKRCVVCSICLLFVLWCVAGAPSAQVSPNPTFEVASVKPNHLGDSGVRFAVQPGGRLTIINIPLREIIRVAYQIQDYQLVGGPDWLYSRFDIIAKAEGDLPPLPPPPAFDAATHPVFPMLRALLSDRFKLAIHRETRSLSMFALVSDRRDGTLGPQLHRSTTDCAAVLAARRAAQQGGAPAPATRSGEAPACGMVGVVGRIAADSQPMSQLVQVLAGYANGVVRDRTDLSGLFSFTLEFEPEFQAQPPASAGLPATRSGGDRPSLFAAVHEQLGLKLERIKESSEVFVIDRVEQPTQN